MAAKSNAARGARKLRCPWATLALLEVSLAAPFAAPEAQERYEGIAYLPKTDHILYRETHWIFFRDGIEQRLVLYRCPGGEPFGRKWVRDHPSSQAPDFDFYDARDGYREGVRNEDGRREIFVQENRQAPLHAQPLTDDPNVVLDAGFDAFVRAHWSELAGGTSETIAFLVPSRFKLFRFKLSGARNSVVVGTPVVQLRMQIAEWYGFALPSVDLTYDRATRRLREFQGIGTIRDASGHNQGVRVVFPIDQVSPNRSLAEVDDAARSALVSSCGVN
jgi:hypothetical protein